MDRNQLVGRLWVLAAGLLWSTSGLFAKAPIWSDWPEQLQGPLFAFWRAFFAAVVLLPAVKRPQWDARLLPLGFIFAAMNLTYLSAVALTTAANAIWLQYTAPWWVFLAALLFLDEKVKPKDWISLAFAGGGVVLILVFELALAVGQQSFSQAGVLCGLASGITFAGVVIFMRLLSGMDPAWLVTVSHLFAVAALLPWVLHANLWPSLDQLLVLAAFGAFQMGIPYTFFIRGLRYIGSHEASVLALVEPILMPIWVLLIWGEKPAWWTTAGAILIFVGLVIRYGVLEVFPGRKSPCK